MIVYEILTLCAGIVVLAGIVKAGYLGFRKLEHNQQLKELEAEKLKKEIFSYENKQSI